LQFWVGVANPQFWGRGGRRGSGMVPFERALVSFYRPSIVTFLLSLRVSEILPLLFCSTPLFPYPTSSLPQISPCSPGSRWISFRLRGAKSAISFRDFQHMWSQITNVTDGQTDGRHAIPWPRKCTKVHCAVKTNVAKVMNQCCHAQGTRRPTNRNSSPYCTVLPLI